MTLLSNHQTKKSTINTKIELKKGSNNKNDMENNCSDLLATLKSSTHILETNKISSNISKPIKSLNTIEKERSSRNTLWKIRILL